MIKNVCTSKYFGFQFRLISFLNLKVQPFKSCVTFKFTNLAKKKKKRMLRRMFVEQEQSLFLHLPEKNIPHNSVNHRLNNSSYRGTSAYENRSKSLAIPFEM